MSNAKRILQMGARFPYDASDAWWNGDATSLPNPPTDRAHAAARGVLADLCDRRGIKRGFECIDETTRVEIVASLAEIIRAAMSEGGEHE